MKCLLIPLKVALFEKGGDLFLPKGGAPSNVILKTRFNDYSINEYVTTHLASYLELNVPETKVKDFDGTLAFLTKRYDRTKVNGETIRLHQEDMCQALSVIPENKYEEDGGPGINRIKDLLIKVTKTPLLECRSFAKAIVFDFLFGNCDAHGKNFSLLYAEDSSLCLAPLYDLLCITIYDELSRKLAMKIGREKIIDRVTCLDVIECGIVGKKEMTNILDYFISSLPGIFKKAEDELEDFAQPTLALIKKDVMNRAGRI